MVLVLDADPDVRGQRCEPEGQEEDGDGPFDRLQAPPNGVWIVTTNPVPLDREPVDADAAVELQATVESFQYVSVPAVSK